MSHKRKKNPGLPVAFLLAALLFAALILVVNTIYQLYQYTPEIPDPREPEARSDSVKLPEETYLEAGPWGPVLDELPSNPYLPEDFTKTGGVISHPDALQGIDVSAQNGVIDWKAVREDGIDFAILQLGYRGYSYGSIHADARFFENADDAVQNGIAIGVYFFSQCLDVSEAEEEARYVVSLLNGMQIDWPVYFDWEPIDGARTDEMDSELLTNCAAAFCKIIADAGYRAGVYFNQEYAYRQYDLVALQDYDYWLAEYASAPSFYYDLQLWQYSCMGSVNGIGTPVDRNLSFVDYSQ